jgi:hypothetical protein
MSNFRRRLLGLAAMGTAFVGVSFGQALTCTDATGNATGGVTSPQINSALRVEGQTEQLSLLQFACTGISATSAPTTLTVTITTNLPITSKAISGLAAGNSEATLVVNGNAAGAGGVVTVGTGTAYQGTVADSGSVGTVTFQGVTIPTSPAPGTITYFQVANVRVNASTATTIPYQSSESGLIAYTTSTTSGVTTAFTSVPATLNSGLVVQSLGPPKITGIAGPYTVCTGNATGLSFTLNINQIISGAFLGLGQPPVGEGGQYAPGAGSAIGAANADIINVTLGGLPSGGTVYVPQSITVGAIGAGLNGTTLSIASSTASTVVVGDVAFSVSSTGTVTIPYTVTAVSGLGAPANSNFPVAVVVAFTANTVTTPTTVTGTYNYAPQGATSLTGPAASVPTFSNATPTAVSGVSIVLCQTTLLFPFVTNQLGFNTGIAIANTSADNLALTGKTFATAQGGTCQLFFYGTNTGAPAANAAGASVVPDPNGNLASGNVSTFLIGNVAPGYQGYMIAVCPFNYAHGYAFLTYGLTTNTGVAEGYIAEVLGTGDRGQSLASGDGAITF